MLREHIILAATSRAVSQYRLVIPLELSGVRHEHQPPAYDAYYYYRWLAHIFISLGVVITAAR